MQYAPSITIEPASAIALASESTSFTSTAVGSPFPVQQWEVLLPGTFVWTPLAGATENTLSIASTTIAMDQTQYRAKFSNVVNTTYSTAATLTVRSAPVIVEQPADISVLVGAGVVIVSSASGHPTPAQKWQLSTDHGVTWLPLAETANTLNLSTTLISDDQSEYRAVFSNVAGSVTSRAMTLSVLYAPIVSLQQPNVTTQPSGVTFVSMATNVQANPPLSSLQWQVSADGGATWQAAAGASSSSTYSFSVAAPTVDGWQYRVLALNAIGSTYSNVVTLHLAVSPVIVTQPVSMSGVLVGTSVTFSVACVGVPTPTVQWQAIDPVNMAATDVPGATSSQYSFTATAASNGLMVQAQCSNAYNVSVSAVASVYLAPSFWVNGTQLALTLTTSSTVQGMLSIENHGFNTLQVSVGQATFSGGNAARWLSISSSMPLSIAPSSRRRQAPGGASSSGVIVVQCSRPVNDTGVLSVGTLVLSTNDPVRSTVLVSVSCAATPVYHSTPTPMSVLDFGNVTKGESSTQVIALQNFGTAPLSVSFLLVSGLPWFSYDSTTALMLPSTAGGTPFEVQDQVVQTGVLTLATDDPAQPVAQYLLKCTARVPPPAAAATPIPTPTPTPTPIMKPMPTPTPTPTPIPILVPPLPPPTPTPTRPPTPSAAPSVTVQPPVPMATTLLPEPTPSGLVSSPPPIPVVESTGDIVVVVASPSGGSTTVSGTVGQSEVTVTTMLQPLQSIELKAADVNLVSSATAKSQSTLFSESVSVEILDAAGQVRDRAAASSERHYHSNSDSNSDSDSDSDSSRCFSE